MAREFDRKLILSDGGEFRGFGFGADRENVCEMVFNTSMVGYLEAVTDLSNTDQAVLMTYPLIGNYGTADEDFETRTPRLGALIVTEYNDLPSNFRATKTLGEILEDNGIPGIQVLDGRALTRRLRDAEGPVRCLICGMDVSLEEGLKKIEATPLPADMVKRVSCRKKWYSRTPNHKHNIVAVDCGIKLSFVKALNAFGCNVTVVPSTTSAEEILSMRAGGVFISNGPGDPKDAMHVAQLIKELRGKLPILGIGLGCQLIALACGADTYRLKAGHRGGNRPVRGLRSGKLSITTQNHGYAVCEKSLAGTGLTVTHADINDGAVEGIVNTEDRLFGIQYYPVMDSSDPIFDSFIKCVAEVKKHA